VGAVGAVGAVGVVIPLAAHLLFPSRSAPILTRFRGFLERREFIVLVLLGVLIGVGFFVDGLRTLD
jgi:hypothetical protein